MVTGQLSSCPLALLLQLLGLSSPDFRYAEIPVGRIGTYRNHCVLIYQSQANTTLEIFVDQREKMR